MNFCPCRSEEGAEFAEPHKESDMRLWRLIGRGLLTVFPSYRPERHYMRGPGPRWRENGNMENWPSKCAVEERDVPSYRAHHG